MNSVIICEGGTDLALLQYFMEAANKWDYKDSLKRIGKFSACKRLVKDRKSLTIGEAGGCSKIIGCLDAILEVNRLSTKSDELYSNLVIISDKDEIETIELFASKIEACLRDKGATYTVSIENDTWIACSMPNAIGKTIHFRLLLLIIPFEETGALETFLLNAIANDDEYEKQIINNCNAFVDSIDPQEKYLNQRRYKTKAKFSVYFSVRKPVEHYGHRGDVVKNIPWEEFETIQNSFKKLKEL